MKTNLLHTRHTHERTFVLVFEVGEEPCALLDAFAERENLSASRITAVGGFSSAVLGYFDRGARRYEHIQVNEQAEVLSILGDVARDEGKPVAHMHAILGLRDGTTRGGHLLEARVWPTLELVLTEWPARLRKEVRAGVGLPLIVADDASAERNVDRGPGWVRDLHPAPRR
jgi:predicted DNA-binding protein with PD1-like motif